MSLSDFSTVLFDLDMTLVNSAALESLRTQRLWNEVLRSLDRVVPFPVATGPPPHELPSILRKAGYKVGVVTSSPQNYAESIVEQFGIECDTLVTYQDTDEHKPDPAPLLKAVENLGVKAAECIHVGNEPIDSEAAHYAGMPSVGVAWGANDWSEIGGNAPDVLIYNTRRLEKPADLVRRRYLADAAFDGVLPLWHEGSLLPFNGLIDGRALGRYFPTEDTRHAGSGLSAAILNLKNEETHVPVLAQWIRFAIERSSFFNSCDGIVSVPPKTKDERNRFTGLLNAVGKDVSSITAYPDGLKCLKDYGTLKGKSAMERMLAVKGAFTSNYNFTGHSLILIDDVATTGATLGACVKALAKSGATEVKVMSLSKDQRTLIRKICPACLRPMRIRTNGSTGEKFWGCSGYPDECKNTEYL